MAISYYVFHDYSHINISKALLENFSIAIVEPEKKIKPMFIKHTKSQQVTFEHYNNEYCTHFLQDFFMLWTSLLRVKIQNETFTPTP